MKQQIDKHAVNQIPMAIVSLPNVFSGRLVEESDLRRLRIAVFGDREKALAEYLEGQVFRYSREFEQIWVALADLLGGTIDIILVEVGSEEFNLVEKDKEFVTTEFVQSNMKTRLLENA